MLVGTTYIHARHSVRISAFAVDEIVLAIAMTVGALGIAAIQGHNLGPFDAFKKLGIVGNSFFLGFATLGTLFNLVLFQYRRKKQEVLIENTIKPYYLLTKTRTHGLKTRVLLKTQDDFHIRLPLKSQLEVIPESIDAKKVEIVGQALLTFRVEEKNVKRTIELLFPVIYERETIDFQLEIKNDGTFIFYFNDAERDTIKVQLGDPISYALAVNKIRSDF